MNEKIVKLLTGLDFGDVQTASRLQLIPLFVPEEQGPSYISLPQAFRQNLISVGEVAEQGSVPELKVTNRGQQSVLLLDGEELAGAKQNRVLNTTVLLRKESETIIPVSCTEQGRWNYNSPEFHDSEVVMSPSIRACKNRSVSASLENQAGYRSDQGEVWQEIQSLHEDAGTKSSTCAMKDAYDQRQEDVGDAMEHFPLSENQKGLLVIIDGRPVGFDLVSRADAYAEFHNKLTRSYVMDALVRQRRGNSTDNPVDAPGLARDFLASAAACEETRHKSVGMGWDCRYQNGRTVGSTLVYRNSAVHCAFFRVDGASRSDGFAGYRRRRSYRQ